jgi:hypothetical protein
LSYADRCLVVDATGTRTLWAGAGRWIAAIDPDGLRLGNRVWPSPTLDCVELRPLDVFDVPGTQIAARRHDDLWLTAIVCRPTFASADINVRVRGNGARADDETLPRWRYVQDGEGTAAISDDDCIAIVTLDRRLRVLRHPAAAGERGPEIIADLVFEHEAYSLSAIDSGFVIVSAIESEPPPSQAQIGRLYARGARPFAASWHSEVRSIDAAGATQWSARVGFPVLQPPIDMGGGRVAVAGRGLACIEAGRVVWTKPANVDVYATAFANGTLAVGIGSRLAIIDIDGTWRSSIELPDGMLIVTPPAIGADRSLAFGTTVHTFVVPAIDG